jgi:hypothetical protein
MKSSMSKSGSKHFADEKLDRKVTILTPAEEKKIDQTKRPTTAKDVKEEGK